MGNKIMKWHQLKKSQRISVAAVCVLLVWLLSGVFFKSDGKELPGLEVQAEVPRVRVQYSQAEEYAREITIYGTTRNTRQVDIQPLIDGRILRITDKKGQNIAAGEWIATLESQGRSESLKGAKAVLKQRKLEYNVARTLARKGHQSETRVAEALAQLRTAEANLAAAEAEAGHTEIVAPFDGVIQRSDLQVGQPVKRLNTVIATVVDRSEATVIAHVPEKFRKDVFLEAKAVVKLATGQEIPAVVGYTSYIASNQTRTFEVELDLLAEDPVYTGVTAEVQIFAEKEKVHRISSSTLALDSEGVLGVKLIGDGNVVEFYPIEVIRTTPDALYVAGLPEKSAIITLGQAYVRAGDTVEIAVSEGQ
jgi:multidrug efflux system membrane fusion protein